MKRNKVASGLISKICNYWRSHVSAEEAEFYRRMLREVEGRALEIACGGGRLLLRFIYEGFKVDGVDSSLFLLDLVRRKAQNAGLTPTLYHQKLDGIEIHDVTYKLIYIPLGSFQLVGDREVAELLLAKYYKMLEPNGRAVIALFLPWTNDHLDTNGWQIIRDVKLQIKNQRYVEREATLHDPVEQLILAKTRFELWDGKDLLQFEEREMHLRWYSKGEFIALLKNVGFSKVETLRSYSGGPPYKDSFLLFIATK
jgi:SAM-dependent methyltransferase